MQRPSRSRAVLFGVAFLLAVDVTAQEEDARERVERMLKVAREGAPAVRGQAARRLLRDRDIALPLLRERTSDLAALAELGAPLVEVLASFECETLRERLWRALEDRDFPWRPAAARSLANTPRPAEKALWEPYVEDPIAPVRAAAIDALVACDPENAEAILRRALLDDDDTVRRGAATRLVERGERWALRWLFEDLRRDDQFFFQLDGRNARFAAMKELARLGVDLGGYRPASRPDFEGNGEALRAIERDLRSEWEESPVPFPEKARASGPLQGEPFLGLELLSCREGELYLRWTRDDVLHVGKGRPVSIPLAPGTHERLLRVAEESLAELGEERIFGEAGCDLEQVYWTGGERIQVYRVSKGYRPAPGLRPAPLARLFEALLASLPANLEHDDPRVANLSTRLLSTLTAIGGPLRER